MERQYTLFQMYSRKGNILSQCDPGDPYTTLCILQPAPSFSAVQELCFGESHTLPKPQSMSSTHFAKYLPHSVPLAPQSMVGRDFLLVWTQCYIFSTSLSFSPFSQPEKGAPSLPQNGSFSLPQFTYTCLICTTLSSSNHGGRFFHSPDQFPGCSKWSELNTVVFKGQRKPRLPYFSAILTPPQCLIKL